MLIKGTNFTCFGSAIALQGDLLSAMKNGLKDTQLYMHAGNFHFSEEKA